MKSLTSIVFKNELRFDNSGNSKISEKLFSILSFVIVFSTIAATVTGASIYITKRLIEINRPFLFIEIMLIGNLGILFFESIIQVINSLYFSKDLKWLLRMPINPWRIINAKLLRLITSEYQMEIIMLAIPMIVYGIMNNVGLMFYIYIPIILLVLPIIPICMTTVIVSLIMRVTNSIKNKSKVLYITLISAMFIMNIVVFNNISILRLTDPIINSLKNFNNIERTGFYIWICYFKYCSIFCNFISSFFCVS